jgi:hypothetical protein
MRHRVTINYDDQTQCITFDMADVPWSFVEALGSLVGCARSTMATSGEDERAPAGEDARITCTCGEVSGPVSLSYPNTIWWGPDLHRFHAPCYIYAPSGSADDDRACDTCGHSAGGHYPSCTFHRAVNR